LEGRGTTPSKPNTLILENVVKYATISNDNNRVVKKIKFSDIIREFRSSQLLETANAIISTKEKQEIVVFTQTTAVVNPFRPHLKREVVENAEISESFSTGN